MKRYIALLLVIFIAGFAFAQQAPEVGEPNAETEAGGFPQTKVMVRRAECGGRRTSGAKVLPTR
jgi:uncharacterized protein YdeI (BOF family)